MTIANARLGAVFLAAFVAGCLALHAIIAFPHIPQVCAKLEALEKASRCNVAFFGSSKVFSGIIPKRFDKLLRERGVAVHSFNFGIDGMGFPESAYVCEEAMARNPGKLRWVFIEAAGIRTRIPEAQRNTRRLIYWHDAPRTLAIFRTILSSNPRASAPEGARGDLMRTHGALFFRRLSNAGEGAELLREGLLGPDPPQGRDRLDPDRFGYVPIEGQPQAADAERLRVALASFGDHVRAEIDPVEEEIMRRFARRIERAGATAIFIIAPNPTHVSPPFSNPAERGAPPVFAFDDPIRFPQLYEIESRGDWAHLNDRGAHALTAALADRFAQFLSDSAL